MKRRTLAILLASVLTALLLTACGGGGGSHTAASGSSSAPMDAAGPSADIGYGGGENGYYGFESSADYEFSEQLVPETPGAAPEPEEDAASDDAGTRLQNAKMIYTASLEAETTDFEACAADLETLVEQVGGYMEYASTNSYGTGYRSASYTARVPAAQFKAFLSSVGRIGHVTYQDKRSENISEVYYDTESRLVTQRTKMERLQALLARAENMEDIITIESAIAETEYEIEQLTGTLRHYDALVDFSTVTITLQEVTRLSTVETTPPSFADQLGTAFTGGVNGFVDFLQALAITVAYSWIWLLILLGVIVLAVRRARRRAKDRPISRPSGFPFSRKSGESQEKKPDDKQPKT